MGTAANEGGRAKWTNHNVQFRDNNEGIQPLHQRRLGRHCVARSGRHGGECPVATTLRVPKPPPLADCPAADRSSRHRRRRHHAQAAGLPEPPPDEPGIDCGTAARRHRHQRRADTTRHPGMAQPGGPQDPLAIAAANGDPKAQEALWAQRLARATEVLDHYREHTKYPFDSRPAREHADQMYPNQPVREEGRLVNPGQKPAPNVRIVSSQERIYVAGNETVRVHRQRS